MLPTAFSTPMFWTAPELAELQASALVQKIGKKDADKMIRKKILPVIRAHEDVFFTSESQKPTDDQLMTLAHTMGSAIMAYAFDLDPEQDDSDEEEEGEDGWAEDREPERQMGMVPLADTLNADAEFNAHISHAADSLSAVSLREIKAGEEILNYYGPLSSAELLRRYGYVTPKHARYDVVELPWVLVEKKLRERFNLSGVRNKPKWKQVVSVATEAMEDGELEEGFVLERETDDPDSNGLLPATEAVFASLPQELVEQVKAFLKAVKKVSDNAIVAEALSDSDTRKEIFLEVVLAALQDREKQYATTLEEDDQLVAGFDPNSMGRKEMAVWVRRGEKQLLREAQVWTARELEAHRASVADKNDGHDGEDGPSAKRRRM